MMMMMMMPLAVDWERPISSEQSQTRFNIITISGKSTKWNEMQKFYSIIIMYSIMSIISFWSRWIKCFHKSVICPNSHQHHEYRAGWRRRAQQVIIRIVLLPGKPLHHSKCKTTAWQYSKQQPPSQEFTQLKNGMALDWRWGRQRARARAAAGWWEVMATMLVILFD